MSIVTELFGKIRQRQVETAIDTFKPYRELLISLATGKSIDPEEAEIILDQHCKSQAELEADSETMRRRLVSAKQLNDGIDAADIIRETSAKIATLVRELDQLVRDRQVKINELRAQCAEAEQKTLKEISAETQLRQSILDPSILQEETELNSRLRQLQVERARHAENLTQGASGSLASNLIAQKKLFADWEQESKRNSTVDGKKYYADQVERHQAGVDQLEQDIQRARHRLTEIDSELLALSKRQKAIELKKLIP